MQRVRTPRRRKIWSGQLIDQNINNTPGIIDLLVGLKTSLGGALQGSTVMRVQGRLALVANAQATSGQYEQILLGFGVFPEHVAQLADGAAGIPIPLSDGSREWPWLQQGSIEGSEDETGLFANQPVAAVPAEAVLWEFDITQQRKFTTSNDTVALAYRDRFGALEANTLAIQGYVNIMLALP